MADDTTDQHMAYAITSMREQLPYETLNGENLTDDAEAAAVIQMFLHQHSRTAEQFDAVVFATWLPTRQYNEEFDLQLPNRGDS